MITYTTPVRGNAVTSLESAWSSVRQPYLFSFQRKDGEYTNTGTQPGTGYLTLAGTNPAFLTRQVYVGESVTAVNLLGQKVTGKIVQIFGNNPAPGPAILVIEQLSNINTFAGGAGFILWGAYENYQVEVILTGDLADGTMGVPLGSAYASTDSYGKAVIDVRDLLLRAMQKVNYFDFGVIQPNVRDRSGWIKFAAEWSDSWLYENRLQSTNTTPQKLLKPSGTNEYWGLDAVKKLMDQYGQNFADYLPANAAYPAKFLTAFKNPTYFIGYPFSLSFIYNRDLAGQDLALVEDELIGQGPGVNIQQSTGLDTAGVGGVNQVAMAGTYDPTTTYVGAYLAITAGAVISFVAFGYVTTGYVVTTTPLPVPPGVTIISESKVVAINRDCRRDPIYLMWKNQLGGWDYWLFDRVQDTDVTSAVGTIWENYVDYIDQYSFRQQISGSTQVTKITMGDSVDKQSLEAIAGIEGSPQVYMLRDPSMSYVPVELNWLGVRMAPKGFKWNNRGSTFDVEVSILLPETWQISN